MGIVRVSQTKGREGDTFHSPITQRERIEAECDRQGFDLLEVHQELDVSGSRPLKKRPGLSSAVRAIEAGDAEIVVAAYLDRLTRSVQVRTDLIDRVEAAGGMVLTVDMGVQSNATAGQWLTGTLSSAVGEYLRRTTTERTALAQQRSIDRGVAPFPAVPPGYSKPVLSRASNGRAIHGPLEIDPSTAPVVVRAFEMRAAGESISTVRNFLRRQGIERSYHGVQAMLSSPIYLGQIHFGDYQPNLEAHPPVISVDLWQRVQGTKIPRGPRPQSERLLARLGVLRCASCGAKMIVGHQTQGRRRYAFYRCIPTGDCTERVTIGAEMIESHIVDLVKETFAGVEGSASVEGNALEIEEAHAKASNDFDAAVRAFAGFENEQAAVDRLRELRQIRDEAREQVDQLGSLRRVLTVTVDDWDRFDLEARRGIIVATVRKATVAPGRGLGRVSVELIAK